MVSNKYNYVNVLVRECDVRWNQIEASLVLMQNKLQKLGLNPYEDLTDHPSEYEDVAQPGRH